MQPRDSQQQNPFAVRIRVLSARLISTVMMYITATILNGTISAWTHEHPWPGIEDCDQQENMHHGTMQQWRLAREQWMQDRWNAFSKVFISTHKTNWKRIQEHPQVNAGSSKKRHRASITRMGRTDKERLGGSDEDDDAGTWRGRSMQREHVR